MAQNVEFKLKFSLDGKEHIISTTDDVKQLAKELGFANVSGDKLRDSLLKINNVTQSFQNAAQGIQELTGTLLDLTDSYATQQINETRLANNMRNTMGAREEEIQSIKDLCSAQQELGVIGDEVQLAGAQELATYLEKKSSLEALIPVMNDMLTQQYGLEASEESATQVAEMVNSSIGGMNEGLRQTPSEQAKVIIMLRQKRLTQSPSQSMIFENYRLYYILQREIVNIVVLYCGLTIS